jgi:hypothetical protein
MNAERRPGQEAATRSAVQDDEAIVAQRSDNHPLDAATPVPGGVEVNDPGTGAVILTVACPFCGGRHRHGYVPGDRDLGATERTAGCGLGSYALDLAGAR